MLKSIPFKMSDVCRFYRFLLRNKNSLIETLWPSVPNLHAEASDALPFAILSKISQK